MSGIPHGASGAAATTAARLAGEAGGPLGEEMHRLLACVHCGFCLQACPTYTHLGDEADSPRGRILLMRAVAEGRLEAAADAFALHLDRCLGCRACETACPAGVEYGHLLERARATVVERRGQRFLDRLLLEVFRRRAATRAFLAAGRLVRGAGLAGFAARALPRRWSRARLALAMLQASRPWKPLSTVGTDRYAIKRIRPRGLRVGLLLGCVQHGLFARVNAATTRVLAAHGCEVVPVEGQQCCGALHAHGGRLDQARDLALANIRAFREAEVDVIAVNAAGCGSTMREYASLFEGHPAAAEAADFVGRVRDISELLVELGPVHGKPLPLRVTYDAPCHLHHAQRITRAPLEVLRSIPALELVPLPGAESCCGGAGSYGLLHPDLAGAILEEKVNAVLGTGADAVVSPNPGCILQIGAGLILAGSRVPVLHPIELLDASYRGGWSETGSSGPKSRSDR